MRVEHAELIVSLHGHSLLGIRRFLDKTFDHISCHWNWIEMPDDEHVSEKWK